MVRVGKIEYDPSKVLGKGGYGFVYSGTFHGAKGEASPVAVKCVQLGDVNIDQREVDALEKLKGHPNIVLLYGAEKNDFGKFFALELCASSLSDIFLRDDHPKKYKGPLPSELDTMLQISEGLAYIHDKGFVHRDVTPGNVLISYPNEDGKVLLKWSDFGLSKTVSPQKTFSISAARGTLTWIAPEILEKVERNADNSEKIYGTVDSDTWSTGCVLFAYLTKGKHPFGDPMDIMRNINDNEQINMKELPPHHFAFDIIKGMIEKDPVKRTKLIDVVKNIKNVKVIELEMERELLDLCSRPSPEPVELDRIATLLQVGVDPNCTNTVGQSLLLLCLENLDGKPINLKRLELLLEGNPSRKVKLEGIEGERTALHWLCRYYKNENIVDAIKILVEKGVDVKMKDSEGRTALHWLCENYKNENIVDAIKILVEKGVDVKMKDSEGRTALHWLCCFYKNENIVDAIKILVEKGVDVKMKDSEGRTALHRLCWNDKNETIVDAMTILIDKGVDVKMKDNYGRTALHLLCQNYKNENIVDAIKILVEKGVDVKLKDKWGHTALHLLCWNDKNENIVDAMKILIEKGVDVKLKDAGGQTALHLLCWNFKNENIVDAMKFLIEIGVDVKMKDIFGRTALHWLCCFYKNENIVDAMKILVEKGVDVKMKDIFGRTALHWLCDNYENENIVDAMKILIEKGVDVKLKDNWGRTALHLLCSNYKNENIVDAMKILVENGVDVKLKDDDGRTALHCLCEYYKKGNIVDAMMLLIENGVDVEVKDTIERRTALDYLSADSKMAACKEKFLEMLTGKGTGLNENRL